MPQLGQRYAWIDLTAGPLTYGPHGRLILSFFANRSKLTKAFPLLQWHRSHNRFIASFPRFIQVKSVVSEFVEGAHSSPEQSHGFRFLDCFRSHRFIPNENSTGTGSLRESELTAAVSSLIIRRWLLCAALTLDPLAHFTLHT